MTTPLDRITGCGTALVTPFQRDGSLDTAALAELVRFQIEERVNFLVPCGTTGESVTMTLPEQLRVVEVVLDASEGLVPVVAGAGGNNTAAVVETARAMASLGVDALLSVTPYYNRPTQEGLFQHYEEIAAAVELPILLYDVPGRTATPFTPETVLRLAELEGIVGLKEASGDIAHVTRIAQTVPRGFKLFSGEDGIVLPVMALGGCGVISVVSNLVPGAMTQLTRLCRDGDLAAARELSRELADLCRACFLETNPIPVKAALELMGRIEANYRLPLVPMSTDRHRELVDALQSSALLPALH